MSVEFSTYVAPNGGGGLVCHKKGDRRVDDATATRCFERAREDMGRHRRQLELAPQLPLQLAEIRLPKNELGDRAVRALVSALLAGDVRVGILELYKNRLGDASAQALATLVEESPAPGVISLHLSHNYFSPSGVGLLLGAAVRCGHYPCERAHPLGNKLSRAPLWLRVERQNVPWKLISGKSEAEQKELARMLITEKERRLSVYLKHKIIPGASQLLCMPEIPESWQGLYRNEEEAMAHVESLPSSSSCCSYRCRHISSFGPMVHLPYFWSQDGRVEKPPTVAALKQEDAKWTTWRPEFNMSFRKKRIRDAEAAKKQALEAERLRQESELTLLAIEARAHAERVLASAVAAQNAAAGGQAAAAPAAPAEAEQAEGESEESESDESSSASGSQVEPEVGQDAQGEEEVGQVAQAEPEVGADAQVEPETAQVEPAMAQDGALVGQPGAASAALLERAAGREARQRGQLRRLRQGGHLGPAGAAAAAAASEALFLAGAMPGLAEGAAAAGPAGAAADAASGAAAGQARARPQAESVGSAPFAKRLRPSSTMLQSGTIDLD